MEQTLVRISEDSRYNVITNMMRQTPQGLRFKKYVSEGMATKHGSFEPLHHDTGIYYEGDTPIYVLVVMTNGLAQGEEFLGIMNLRIHEWQEENQL